MLDRRTAAAGRSRLRLALCILGAAALCPGAPAALAGSGPLLAQVFPDGLPFPFEAVLDQLREAAGPENVATALIPLGRSLQRYAAHPDYFASPRIVVAVTGDSSAGPHDLRLADRLFLGYQPAAAVIEAISYDPDAGRFAFQEVVGYGPGPAAPAEDAERGVCLACHQAGGPIFARPLWSESNANAEVAARLAPLGASFHGAAVAQTVDAFEAFDAATDRAARIALADRLWQQACPDAACRAALLAAALRAGLGAALPAGPPGFDARTRRLWPEGVGASSPDLPNRDPLPAYDAAGAVDAPRAADPEIRRPPVALWRPGPDGFAAAALAIAEQLSAGDYLWIDARLRAGATPVETVTLPCTTAAAALPSGGTETRFACTAGAARLDGFQAPDGSGRITLLALPGQPPARQLALGPGRAPRLPDGRRLDAFALAGGTATLGLVDDLTGLERRLAAADAAALEPGPFPRTAVLALIAALLGKTDG